MKFMGTVDDCVSVYLLGTLPRVENKKLAIKRLLQLSILQALTHFANIEHLHSKSDTRKYASTQPHSPQNRHTLKHPV